MRAHPVSQRGIAFGRKKRQEGFTETLTIVPQIVAVQQRNRRTALRNTLCQNMAECAVEGADIAIQIGLHICLIEIQGKCGCQEVTRFGHGKANHTRFRAGPLLNQRTDITVPWQNFAQRSDGFVVALTFRRYGFQHIFSLLRRELIEQRHCVITDIAERDAPAFITLLTQFM